MRLRRIWIYILSLHNIERFEKDASRDQRLGQQTWFERIILHC